MPDETAPTSLCLRPRRSRCSQAPRAEFTPAAKRSAGPTALSTPAMSSTLAKPNADPMSADVGFLGKIYFSSRLYQRRTPQPEQRSPGQQREEPGDFSPPQIEVQKTDGVVQFYVQAGTYNWRFVRWARPMSPPLDYRGGPTGGSKVAFLKLAPNAEWSVLIGKLPTLIGAEYTFTFENLNIARGLLWNQEPAISRGVQVNYAKGPLTVSGSWNDGYYSGDYTTLSGLISYALTPKDTVVVAGSGNTDYQLDPRTVRRPGVPQNCWDEMQT